MGIYAHAFSGCLRVWNAWAASTRPMRPLQNLRFERISKIASHHAQIILKYFQALERRIAKKWAKDEDFAKVSAKKCPAKSRD